MHRSKLADELLGQIQLELRANIVIISEQYPKKQKSGWFVDSTDTAAIWIPNPKDIIIKSQGTGTGYVWIQTDEITFMSCYLTPNEPIGVFQNKLNNMEDDIRNIQGQIFLAGDVNAKALEWGMTNTDSRGRRILEMAARLGLNVINTGNTTTFRRPGYGETIPDVTFASETLASQIKNWKVLENYTGSDHQYIVCDIGKKENQLRHTRKIRWNTSKLNEENLTYSIDNNKSILNKCDSTVEDLTRKTMYLIKQSCDASMPRKNSNRTLRQSMYWWTEEINDLRKVCLRLRRKITRNKRHNSQVDHQTLNEYKTNRREFKMAIKVSKRRKWESLINEVNNDPWGLGYKIVTNKILEKAAGPVLDEIGMRHIVDALFPDHPITVYQPEENVQSVNSTI